MTNGDKIRNLDNHNLALALSGYFATYGELLPFAPECEYCESCEETGGRVCEECPETIENWLEAEVKE